MNRSATNVVRLELSLLPGGSSNDLASRQCHPYECRPARDPLAPSALLQRQNFGSRYFVGTNQSGRVYVGPLAPLQPQHSGLTAGLPRFSLRCMTHRTFACGTLSQVLLVTIFILVFQTFCPAEPKVEPAWRALPLITDGKVDPAWTHIGWGGFAVDDGALRTECDAKGLGLLVYKKERLGNCQIRVVFKTKDARSNAGIYVRIADGILEQGPGASFDRDAAGKVSNESSEKMKASSEKDEGPWFAVHRGYEVQIADTGDPFHRTGAIYSLAPSSASPKKAGEWKTMVITLAGERVFVALDTQRVTSFDPAAPDLPSRKQWYEPKREPKRPESGYIGLQNHDPGDVVWFKEISVRPLPDREFK